VNGTYNETDISYAVLSNAQVAALNAGTLAFSNVTFSTVTGNYYGVYNYALSGNGTNILIGAAVTPYYGGQSVASAFLIQNLNVTETPEPASVLLICSGLLAGAFFARRRLSATAN
jgi:hypothetical protein